MSDNSSGGTGWELIEFILVLFIIWAFWFGLETPWGKYNLDIWPPRIWQMDEDGDEIPPRIADSNLANQLKT